MCSELLLAVEILTVELRLYVFQLLVLKYFGQSLQ